jgi:hypothetical protein
MLKNVSLKKKACAYESGNVRMLDEALYEESV